LIWRSADGEELLALLLDGGLVLLAPARVSSGS
jgi:hypothetical protein